MSRSGTGPLAGVRVVELEGIGPAPYGVMLLADLGADVVRVRRPERADAPDAPLDRGRRTVVVDLRTDEGRATVLALAARADVLVEGFRPGVVERLGVGPDAVEAVNPRLVYGRMTGWGQDGPLAPRAGHDLNYLAVTGVLHAIGPRDEPAVPLNLLGDFGGGGTVLALGVVAALLARERTGIGQVVDASIVDGVASMSTMALGSLAAGRWSEERASNRLDGGAPFYSVYRTGDGEHVAVGALEDRFYAELLERLGLDDLPDRADPGSWPAIRERLATTFATRTRAQWEDHFASSDACVSPVLRWSEAVRHPHVSARGTLVDDDGLRTAVVPRLSGTPGRYRGPATSSTADAVLASWTAPP